MTMCASGSLGIISCPQGGCSSIAMAVDGNITGSKSLSTLSTTAGKSAPHSMIEFYGYGTAVQKCVNILNLTCVGQNLANAYATGCLCTDPAMSAGEFYCPTINWYLHNDLTCGSIAAFCVLRNTVCFCGCGIGPGSDCSGSISFCVPYGDAIVLCTRTRVFANNVGTANEAYLYLASVSGCANFCIYASGERAQDSLTCGMAV